MAQTHFQEFETNPFFIKVLLVKLRFWSRPKFPETDISECNSVMPITISNK